MELLPPPECVGTGARESQTHLTPSQSFHGVWTSVPFLSGCSQDAPVAPMGLLTAAVGKEQAAALVAPFGAAQLGDGTLCMGSVLATTSHPSSMESAVPARVCGSTWGCPGFIPTMESFSLACLTWHSHR